MADEQYPHLKFERFFTSGEFRNPRSPRDRFKLFPRARIYHGRRVQNQFQNSISAFKERAKIENEELFNEDIIYLEFESEPGYHFKTDSFDSGYGHYKLSYSKIEKRRIDGEEKEVQKIGVYINKKGVSAFLKKIDQFVEENTPKGHPKNQPLLANIASIRSATLECFWTEPTEPFPGDEEVWWEVWLRRDTSSTEEKEYEPVKELLTGADLTVGERRILFPEHIIILVRGTADQLSSTLLYTDKLSELRKPKETAEFFLREELEDPEAWLEDFQNRIEDLTDEHSVLICLLDSGVNRGHPLIAPYLPNRNMVTIDANWGTADSVRRGHGTQMAGNALFGDLTEHLTGTHQIELYHNLESVKIYNPAVQNDEKLYGAITIEAASQAVVINPDHKRIYCMAVTSDSFDHKGEPSSWSSAVDQIVFGEVGEPNEKSLFLIPAGNVWLEGYREYPRKNEQMLINDPSQAFNVVTIGAYTEKDYINPIKHPNSFPLANRGVLSPFSTTGIKLAKQWANKPDVVFEGGNLGVQQDDIIDPDSLKLLSVGHDPQRHIFSDNYATSAATALASKFTAELYSEYPDYWPETIRGLMIHSSDWTDDMTRGNHLKNVDQKKKLLRTYGYGVPNLEKARYSAGDRLTLIAERTIQPFTEGSSDPKINEYHLYELPWPREALESLFEEDIRVNVTLSYFIEPNPGKKEYSQNYSYQSAGLRFKMCRTNESTTDFAARVNRLARTDDYETGADSENWALGPEVRNKGSIHRDWLMTTGPELASKNKIVVFPIGGWWKTRKKLERYHRQVRYSLIVSIDAPNTDIEIDLYTPVRNLIDVDIEV